MHLSLNLVHSYSLVLPGARNEQLKSNWTICSCGVPQVLSLSCRNYSGFTHACPEPEAPGLLGMNAMLHRGSVVMAGALSTPQVLLSERSLMNLEISVHLCMALAAAPLRE